MSAIAGKAMSRPTPSEARSLWAATAGPAPVFPSLNGEHRADVAIIGGGFTGLSAAHHVAKAGAAPVVLEAATLGWGASGRNGGYVSPKVRASLPAVMAAHGREAAKRIYELGHEAVDCVEELAAVNGIAEAAFKRYGHITGALNEAALGRMRADAAWLASEFGDRATTILTREEIAAAFGSDAFIGGSLNLAEGGIHPLNFVRGMAAAIARAGIAVFERSPALVIREEAGGVVVETAGGLVRARKFVLATNAYSDMTDVTGDLRRRIVPFRSAAIATSELSDDLLKLTLPGGRMGSDSKRVLRWFRMIGRRLVFGGRGAFGRDGDSPSSYERLRRNMVEIFPHLRDTQVEFRWSGLVAMTMDFLPHIGRVGTHGYYAMGYNGTGVAMSNLMGKYLARFIRNEPVDAALLMTAPFRPIPFHFLRAPVVRAATAWYQLLDGAGR